MNDKVVTTAEVGITIKMPKELLNKWLAALRSGEYKQGVHKLQTASGSFCCLGVLQKAVDGKCEMYNDDSMEYRALPSQEWLEKNNIEFSGCGHLGQAPFLPTLGCSATDANDAKKKSFAEIADAIEACAEGV